jgi:hypothetical protein
MMNTVRIMAMLLVLAPHIVMGAITNETDIARFELQFLNELREGIGVGLTSIIPDVCFAPSPLPTAPSAAAQAVPFAGAWSNSDAFTGTLWREPCPTDSSQYFIYLRVVPTRGVPFICSSAFYVIQNASQYTVKLSQSQGGSSFCDDLFVPSTFLLKPWLPPYYDGVQALTLLYKGVYVNSTATLPGFSAQPTPIAPAVGLWWNPLESGSGYALDFKHGVLVVTTYSYTAGGASTWYISSGPVVNNTFTARLDKFVAGQCISCGYRPPTSAGDDGNMVINFTSSTSATMTLPGGRSFPIIPQNF